MKNLKTLVKKGNIFSIILVILLATVIAGLTFNRARVPTEEVFAQSVPTVSSFNASEDTYITQKSPSTNFKSVNVLYIQNKTFNKGKALVRFIVSGIPNGATINSASLSLYVSNGVKVGGSVDSAGYISGVNGAWSSSTVTWNNAPAEGAKINNLEPHASAVPGEWRNSDISSVVTGNGTYDFYVLNDSVLGDDIQYASLESTAKSSGSSTAKPVLSITWIPAGSNVLTHGPVVGGVTDSSAKVFVRAGTTDQVRLKYGNQPNYEPSTVLTSDAFTPEATQDYTAIIPLFNLSPNTKYYYWVLIGAQEANILNRYEFTTFPSVDSVQDFSFSIFSDGAAKDYYAPGYATAALMNPVFVGQIGDFRHQDPSAIPTPIAINNWWLQNKQSIGEGYSGTDFANNIGAKFPFFHIWDDHDFCKNNSDKTCEYKDTFSKPSFTSYFPTYPLDVGDGSLGHSFRYGKEAEVFVMDLRYQRSPDTDVDGPTKSMLGDTQKAWLKSKLKAAQDSGVTWKFLVSTSVWNDKSKVDDSWFLYQTEQNELINYIKDNGISNVVVISGDLHSGGGIDDGSGTISCSIGWCIPEISVPHTNIYQQTDCTGGTWGNKNCGTWAVGFLFAKDATTKISNAGFAHFTVTGASVLMQVIREDGKINLSYTVPVR